MQSQEVPAEIILPGIDETFLTSVDAYQEQAYRQIAWDSESPSRIRGLHPVAYMLKGLKEELGELTEPDRTEPGYSRLGSLLSIEDNPRFQAGIRTDTAVKRHLKEFGDVSWYMSNYLKIFRINFSRVIEPGMQAWRLEGISQPRATYQDFIDSWHEYPWSGLLASGHELSHAAEHLTMTVKGEVFPKFRDQRIIDEQRLIVSAGKFTIAMVHMLKERFGTEYIEVLNMNKAKLDKRISDGTVFDKSGGDDR